MGHRGMAAQSQRFVLYLCSVYLYSVFSVFVSLVQLSCGWRRVDEMLDAAVTVKVTLGLVFWKQSPFT